MKIYVYCIYFPTSKRINPHYIGIAKNLEKRLPNHLYSKRLVGNALNKYNDWIIKKLHTCKTYEEAFKIEIEEIRNFNCVAPNGYNLTRGGEGGDYWSGKKNLGTAKAMIGNQNGKGYEHTKEAIEKMKGKKHPAVSESNKRRKGNKRLDTAKRNKENNPMKDSKVILKFKVTCLKTAIKKLELI